MTNPSGVSPHAFPVLTCVSPGEMKGDVDDTLEAFEDVLHLYKSGIHLDNMPPSLIRGNVLCLTTASGLNGFYSAPDWPRSCSCIFHAQAAQWFIQLHYE